MALSMEMDYGVSVRESPNPSTKIETEKVIMPSSSKESPVHADSPTDSRLNSNQSFMWPPAVNLKDSSVSVNETLNSAMSNETNNVSVPSSEDSPVTAGDLISEIGSVTDQPPIVLPVKKSQDLGVSVKYETLGSAMNNGIDMFSALSFSQGSPARNSLDSDRSSMEPLVKDPQDTSVSINETLNSAPSNEIDEVSMPPSSKGSPVNTDNPIENRLESDQSLSAPPSTNPQDISVSVIETMTETLNSALTPSNETDKSSMSSSSKESLVNTQNPIDENSLESDQSLLPPPSTNSQYVSVSVNETPNSATSNGTDKVPMPSSSEGSLVIADDQLVKNSLDSDHSSIVLPETKTESQDIDVSVIETLNSSSNETDKVSNPSNSKENPVPVIADNPIAKNSSDSDQPSTAPPVTKSQDIVSKENFYDCETWLGSDSDDDFFSVKGDYSRQSSIKESPQLEEISDSELKPYPMEGREKHRLSSYQVDDHIRMPPTNQDIKRGKSKQKPPPINEDKKLAELLREPFWSDHVNDHKEKKLIEFFQDSNWSQEIASSHATPFPSTTGNGKLRSDIAAPHLSPKDGTSTVPREYPRTLNNRAPCVTGDLKQESTARASCCFPSWSPSRVSKERKNQTPPRSQR